MQIIFKASDIGEAHIVAGLLNSNGIGAHVGGHYLQGGVGDLAALDFANVQVADEDVETARTVITKYEKQTIPKNGFRPNSQPTLTSKLLLVIFATVLSITIVFAILK